MRTSLRRANVEVRGPGIQQNVWRTDPDQSLPRLAGLRDGGATVAVSSSCSLGKSTVVRTWAKSRQTLKHSRRDRHEPKVYEINMIRAATLNRAAAGTSLSMPE
ncbi:hypothetical protein ACQP1O_16695 [Nocardia sp. CA-151230]|uniref:hypothetical protein n=1 Tax=Nocardia sp. CA-151230 TaxID=3239982 RepID=UPI003D93AAAA